MSAGTYMQSIMWTCTSCGFAKERDQPMYECPLCEAYKSVFISTPGHVQRELVEKYGEDGTNTAEARKERLQILKDKGYLETSRFRSRMLEHVYTTERSRKTI